MFLKITNGKPEKYTIGKLRRDNPQVSFPKNISKEILVQYKVYPYYLGRVPVYDKLTATIKEDGFKRDDKANWYLSYIVEDLPPSQAAKNIRKKRDDLLSQSDWTQVVDTPVNQKLWADYRQALRNIPQQPNFPFNVVWPESP